MPRPTLESLFPRAGLRARHSASAARADGQSRRQFLQSGVAAGLAATLPAWLSGCGGGDDDDGGGTPATVQQTVFFNLSHLKHAGRTYYLEAGGHTHTLVAVADKPEVLSQARASNEFLAAVGDEHITHHVEAMVQATTTMQLNYVWTWVDQSAGTWEMAAVYATTPTTATAAAFQHLAARSPAAAVSHRSHKRKRYSVRPAATAKDLADEAVLIDSSTHASTLIGLNPHLLSFDADTHAIVHTSYIDGSAAHDTLSDDLTDLGPAQLETSPGVVSDSGWATLRPALKPDGSVHRVTADANSMGRIQAQPIFHGYVNQDISDGHLAITPQVLNDTSLGVDTTASPDSSLTKGKLWVRRDGTPTIASTGTLTQAGAAAVTTGLTLTPLESSGNNGLYWTVTPTDNGDTVQVDVTLINTYLRYLSLWVAFYDEKGTQLQLSQVGGFTDKTLFAGGDINMAVDVNTWGSKTQLLLGIIPPPATIFGVPVNAGPFEGKTSLTLNVPKSVHKVSFFSGGLGTGANDNKEVIAGGTAMTIINNYMVTALFAGLGAIPDLDDWSSILQPIAYDFLEGVFTEALDVSNGEAFLTPSTLIDQGMNLLTNFLNYLAGQLVDAALNLIFTALGRKMVLIAAQDGVEKAVPLAGLVMNAVSAVIGAADMVLTSVDIGRSPWVYTNSLVFSYDLTVTLVPHNNSTFPPVPCQITVTATADDATTHTLTQSWDGGADPSLSFTFPQLPLGGNITVTANFDQMPTVKGGTPVNLATGTTGITPNNGNPITVPVDLVPFPIDGNTIFRHNRRTMLDENGNRHWVDSAAPIVNLGNLQTGQPGELTALRGITLRQGTPTLNGVAGVPLRIGYAWSSRNLGPGAPVSCAGGTSGDLEQIATINGDSPGTGFAVTPCGSNKTQQHVAFQLLGGATPADLTAGKASGHFYLDTSTAGNGVAGYVRQITLDPTPTIDGNTSNRAFCTLSRPSDAFLLHPSGYFISVSNVHSVIEVFKIPDTPLDDVTARTQLRAYVRSGKGDRPGLISGPVCATVTSKGVLLILEHDNNRIQAMDIGCNPVQYFSNLTQTPYWLNLPDTDTQAGWVHLDMQVDSSDLIYVLSYNPNSGGAYEYRLNVYSASQSTLTPLCTTTGLYADKIAVDLFRNVYSLNYEVIQSDVNPLFAPALTEPSISLWGPCKAGSTCSIV